MCLPSSAEVVITFPRRPDGPSKLITERSNTAEGLRTHPNLRSNLNRHPRRGVLLSSSLALIVQYNITLQLNATNNPMVRKYFHNILIDQICKILIDLLLYFYYMN